MQNAQKWSPALTLPDNRDIPIWELPENAMCTISTRLEGNGMLALTRG